MARPSKRIRLEPDTDLADLVEQVRTDKEPRLLERHGEQVAVLLSLDDYAELTGDPKSKRNKEKLLTLAGAWSDIDANDLVDMIYRSRHESPPSPHTNL
jgi:prevent-host-death family protein